MAHWTHPRKLHSEKVGKLSSSHSGFFLVTKTSGWQQRDRRSYTAQASRMWSLELYRRQGKKTSSGAMSVAKHANIREQSSVAQHAACQDGGSALTSYPCSACPSGMLAPRSVREAPSPERKKFASEPRSSSHLWSAMVITEFASFAIAVAIGAYEQLVTSERAWPDTRASSTEMYHNTSLSASGSRGLQRRKQQVDLEDVRELVGLHLRLGKVPRTRFHHERQSSCQLLRTAWRYRNSSGQTPQPG